MNTKESKPWYKKFWVWLIIIVVLIGVGSAIGGNTDNNSSTSDTETSNNEQKNEDAQKPKEEKWDVETAYAKLVDGMTKAEAEAALGKTSDNCSETSAEYVGVIETCNYGGVGDNGMIMVQYQNDKLTTKTKSKF
jgi:hypothetical protein